MYAYNKEMGKTIDASVLLAAAKDNLNDVFATFAVMVSCSKNNDTKKPQEDDGRREVMSGKEDVEKILEKGKNVLTVMDICGAMALKTHFSNVTTIYIKQNKRDLLENLLTKPLSMDEKISRILALEAEEKNAEICDYTVKVDSFDTAAREILDGLFGKKKKRG